MDQEVMRRGALFIRETAINWDAAPRGSYLRDIPALKGFTRLAFDSNVTFFAGENGTGTESYQITKLFLERRMQMLDELFKSTEE